MHKVPLSLVFGVVVWFDTLIGSRIIQVAMNRVCMFVKELEGRCWTSPLHILKAGQG